MGRRSASSIAAAANSALLCARCRKARLFSPCPANVSTTRAIAFQARFCAGMIASALASRASRIASPSSRRKPKWGRASERLIALEQRMRRCLEIGNDRRAQAVRQTGLRLANARFAGAKIARERIAAARHRLNGLAQRMAHSFRTQVAARRAEIRTARSIAWQPRLPTGSRARVCTGSRRESAAFTDGGRNRPMALFSILSFQMVTRRGSPGRPKARRDAEGAKSRMAELRRKNVNKDRCFSVAPRRPDR